MKKLGLLIFLTASTSVFADENPDQKGKCFEVNGKILQHLVLFHQVVVQVVGIPHSK
ncbi:exported hypothetical protein [Acinetobacter proteolyticus]|jgi:hypothetical protein|uniref:Uncharacterized protein n=1 Tax=Acinetobacter proteolyticus TaxID=1776741 RepID=A0A653K1E3_9GAMM|nr:hypothetical protein [Acinetobacter proteolyticus]VXA54536.1 exported hypothetical protein [Acinetobacter proteolyticus]